MVAEIAVLGAGGGTGRKCVEKLLEQNKSVKAIVRDPAKYQQVWASDDSLSIGAGDVTDPQSLEAALGGAKGIIYAVSASTYLGANAVDKEGVKNVADIAKRTGAHVVLISSAFVTPKNRFHPIRILLNNFRWGIMDAKFAGENLLRQSGASYTVVRPGGLTNDPPGKYKLQAGQKDQGKGGRISRADVAAVCVAALTNPKARSVTLEISTDPKTAGGRNDVNQIFDNMQPNIFD